MLVDISQKIDPRYWAAMAAWGERVDPVADEFPTLAENAFAPGAAWRYNHPLAVWLLEALTPAAATCAGIALRPSHCVARIVGRGDVVRAHTDNPKIVPPGAGSFNFSPYTDAPWPLEIERDGDTVSFLPEARQAVFFRSTVEQHGRPGAFGGQRHTNFILCYAAADDPTVYPHQMTFEQRIDWGQMGLKIIHDHLTGGEAK